MQMVQTQAAEIPAEMVEGQSISGASPIAPCEIPHASSARIGLNNILYPSDTRLFSLKTSFSA
jgi:hypothetical protein